MTNKFDQEIEKRLSDTSYDSRLANTVLQRRQSQQIKRGTAFSLLSLFAIFGIFQFQAFQEQQHFLMAVQEKFADIQQVNYDIIDLSDASDSYVYVDYDSDDMYVFD